MTGDAGRRAPVLVVAALAALLAAVVRWPSLALPVDGEGADAAALARSLAGGEGFAHAAAPLFPLVAALPVALGATPTGAVRGLSVLFAALAAAGVVLVGARLGLRSRLPLLGGLAALHPLVVSFVGGVAAGPHALGLALVVFGAWALLADVGVTRRTGILGLVAWGLAPLAGIANLAFALAGVGLAGRAGGGRRRVAVRAGICLLPTLLVLGLGAVVGSPGRGAPLEVDVLRVVLLGVGIPISATLLVLAPFLLSGWRRLVPAPPTPARFVRDLLGASVLQVCVSALVARTWTDGFSEAGPAIAVLLLAAVAGLEAREGRWARRARWSATGIAVAGCALVVLPALARPVGLGGLPASRLDRFAAAFRRAAAEARPGGLVALDLATAPRGLEAFVGDLDPRVRTGVVRGAGGAPRDPAAKVAPLEALPPRAGFVLLTDRALDGPVYTAEGRGIFHRVLFAEMPGADGTLWLHHVTRP